MYLSGRDLEFAVKTGLLIGFADKPLPPLGLTGERVRQVLRDA